MTTSKKSIPPAEALSRLQKMCSLQEKCASDLLQLLKRWGLEEPQQEEIIKSLEDDQFLDEQRFAIAYVRDKVNFDHWGFIKIQYLLKQKGIPGRVIRDAWQTIDADEYKKMITRELEKKRKTLKGAPREIWAKLARYGTSRGYEMDHMHGILDEIAPED